jgi:Asp/Glu/hydantoin racemase
MRTLFLNPNASTAVTALLRQRVAAARPAFVWDLRCIEQAPEVIASAADHTEAEIALAARLPALAARWQRLVLMSSLDTGHALAMRLLPGVHVEGFTRAVLARQGRMDRRVHVLTFGAPMKPLYAQLFADAGAAALVARHAVCDIAAGSLLQPGAEALRAKVASVCDALHGAEPLPVFIVGALALPLADQLRAAGRPWIVDPIADLLASLCTPAR